MTEFGIKFEGWRKAAHKVGVESKRLFFDCVRQPDLGFSRNRPFWTDNSDCIIIGISTGHVLTRS